MPSLLITSRNTPSSDAWIKLIEMSSFGSDILVISDLKEVFPIMTSHNISLLVIDCELRSMSIYDSIRMSKSYRLSSVSIVVANGVSVSLLSSPTDRRPEFIIERPLKISEIKKSLKIASEKRNSTIKQRHLFDNNMVDEIKLELDKLHRYTVDNQKISDNEVWVALTFIEILFKNKEVESSVLFLNKFIIASPSLDVKQKFVHSMARYFLSISKPEKAIKLLKDNQNNKGSVDNFSLYLLSESLTKIGEHARSNQLLEMLEIQSQYTPSQSYSLKAFNCFDLKMYAGAVTAQIESIRWINLELDDNDDCFNQYLLLTKYAEAYWRSNEDIDKTLIKNISSAFISKNTFNSDKWMEVQSADFKIRELIVKGDVGHLISYVKNLIENNVQILDGNDQLISLILKQIGKFELGEFDYDMIISLAKNKKEIISSSSLEDRGHKYYEMAVNDYQKGDASSAELLLLKARIALPKSIIVNILHIRVNISLYIKFKSERLLSDSYRYLETLETIVNSRHLYYATFIALKKRIEQFDDFKTT